MSGWYRRLNAKAERGSLQLYVLLRLLLQESKLVQIQLQLVADETVGQNRQQVYESMDACIHALWDPHDNHDIKCADFLKEIGTIYGVVYVVYILLFLLYFVIEY